MTITEHTVWIVKPDGAEWCVFKVLLPSDQSWPAPHLTPLEDGRCSVWVPGVHDSLILEPGAKVRVESAPIVPRTPEATPERITEAELCELEANSFDDKPIAMGERLVAEVRRLRALILEGTRDCYESSEYGRIVTADDDLVEEANTIRAECGEERISET